MAQTSSRFAWPHVLHQSDRITQTHAAAHRCYAWWTRQDVWHIINQVCASCPRDLVLKYDKTNGASHSLGIHLFLCFTRLSPFIVPSKCTQTAPAVSVKIVFQPFSKKQFTPNIKINMQLSTMHDSDWSVTFHCQKCHNTISILNICIYYLFIATLIVLCN